MNIHQHALAGDHAALAAALERGAEVDARDDAGRTPLMVAVLSPAADLRTLELLVAHGANVDALTGPDPRAALAEPQLETLRGLGIDTSIFEHTPEVRGGESVLYLAVKHGNLEKIRRLIAAGADPTFVDASGISLLTCAVYRALALPWQTQRELLTALLDAGAPLDLASQYGESPVRVASIHGLFEALALLLGRGADPAPLDWTPLHFAVAMSDVAAVQARLDAGDPLETRDAWERTPFLLAVHAGKRDVAALLLSRGADRAAKGRCGSSALKYPIWRDDDQMLAWLVSLGFDIEATDDHGNFPLLEAAQYGARRCVQRLLASGAVVDRSQQFDATPISEAASPEIVDLLVTAGADLSEVDSEMRVRLLHAESVVATATEGDYRRHWKRAFGRPNPERMNNPLWELEVRVRESAYSCARRFDDTSDERHPVWCFMRFGQSLTQLPDGRHVEIGGEHEDYYDEDFCIYNDVVVHDHGAFAIYGYPEKVFPPTDFHSATLVGTFIYIIGNLGYVHQRRRGETPVYRLNCETWSIEQVACRGAAPGWIHRHQARLVDERSIEISGGKIEVGAREELQDNKSVYRLDLATSVWTRLD